MDSSDNMMVVQEQYARKAIHLAIAENRTDNASNVDATNVQRQQRRRDKRRWTAQEKREARQQKRHKDEEKEEDKDDHNQAQNDNEKEEDVCGEAEDNVDYNV